MTDYANTLSNAAVAAYNWAVANPSVICSPTPDLPAPTPNGQSRQYEPTCRFGRRCFFTKSPASPLTVPTWKPTIRHIQAISGYWWNYYDMPVEDALLYYTTLPGVTPAVASTIRSHKQGTISGSDYYGRLDVRQGRVSGQPSRRRLHLGQQPAKGSHGDLVRRTDHLRTGPRASGRLSRCGGRLSALLPRRQPAHDGLPVEHVRAWRNQLRQRDLSQLVWRWHHLR